MSGNEENRSLIVNDQKEITATAVDVIRTINQRRGQPLQPRDRMALQLLTPKNSALILDNGVRNLGCRQVSFDIYTQDLGKGVHRLRPVGIHVFRPGKGWWSSPYGQGRFLWNLYHKESTDEGIRRILERLFKFRMRGVFGPKAEVGINENKIIKIAGQLDQTLRLYIQREEGNVETSLRRLVRSDALYLPSDIGLKPKNPDQGYVVLLFGKKKRYGISFRVEQF